MCYFKEFVGVFLPPFLEKKILKIYICSSWSLMRQTLSSLFLAYTYALWTGVECIIHLVVMEPEPALLLSWECGGMVSAQNLCCPL